MRGQTERRREDRQSKQQQAFRRVLRDVARDENHGVTKARHGRGMPSKYEPGVRKQFMQACVK
jgi:hypothetical protein